MLRRVLGSVSFGICCFLNTWVGLAEGGNAYLARHDPFHAVCVPALLLQTAAAGVAFLLWTRRWLFLAACAVPAGIAAVAVTQALPFDPSLWTPLVQSPVLLVVAVIAATFAAALRPSLAHRVAREVLVYSTPVLALIVVQSFRNLGGVYVDGPTAGVVAGPEPPVRVVWIVFDELHKPGGVRLPHFDRLGEESFSAEDAVAPADETMLCIPALITGQRVTAAKRMGPGRLDLQTEGDARWRPWRDIPNVFDAARSRGVNTALVGWFHPYCRILNRSLSECHWTAAWLPPGLEEPLQAGTPGERLALRLARQRDVFPLAGRLGLYEPWRIPREEHLARLLELLEHSRRVAADGRLGLVMIHLPVPHPPPVYDRRTGAYTTGRGPGYLDSVVLADRVFGELRVAMELAGVWDRTAVLVTGDHGWRPGLWRGSADWGAEDDRLASQGDVSTTPFWLKLPHTSESLRYPGKFETIRSRRITEGILSGAVKSAKDVAALAQAGEDGGLGVGPRSSGTQGMVGMSRRVLSGERPGGRCRSGTGGA